MSSLKRFFTDKIDGVFTSISGSEVNHAVNVLRLRTGDKVILCDNSGYEYTAEITSVNKKEILFKIENKELSDKESKNSITLICGFLKGDKTELIVQKAVELGVKKIIVFNSTYSSAYLSDGKLERLNKVSVEAAKQCGRAIAPKVEGMELFDALMSVEGIKNKIFACEFSKDNEIDMRRLKGDTAVVVGSEGGFSPDELKMAKKLGFKEITLGKRILRAETAAIAMLSILSFELGDLS